MTDLKPIDRGLSALTVDQLRAELVRGLSMTADGLRHAAAVWAELERRGEDLAEHRDEVGRNLPLIAAGRLAAEAVVAFLDRPTVLRAIEGLPLARQRELAAGGTVEFLAPGRTEPEAVPLAALPAAAVRIVFADGVERSPAEQRATLAVRKPRQGKPAGYTYRPVVDRGRRVVRVGKMEVSVEAVLAAFAEAAAGRSGPDPGVARDRGQGLPVASCYLTDEESGRLDALCKAKKADRGDLVRMAVVAMLLL